MIYIYIYLQEHDHWYQHISLKKRSTSNFLRTNFSRLELVSRLDQPTSGVLPFTLPPSSDLLRAQFTAGLVAKAWTWWEVNIEISMMGDLKIFKIPYVSSFYGLKLGFSVFTQVWNNTMIEIKNPQLQFHNGWRSGYIVSVLGSFWSSFEHWAFSCLILTIWCEKEDDPTLRTFVDRLSTSKGIL